MSHPAEVVDRESASAALARASLSPNVQALANAFDPAIGLAGLVQHVETTVLPRASPPDQVQLKRILDAWRHLPSQSHGGRESLLGRLLRVSNGWDMRCGSERDAIPRCSDMFTDAVTESVFAVADEWRLVEPSHPPLVGSADALVVLGGLAQATRLRVRRGVDLIESGVARELIGIACARPLGRDEDQLGRGAATEFDVMQEELENYAGIPRESWSPRSVGAGTMKVSLAAPFVSVGLAPADPRRKRANTNDTLRWLLAAREFPRDTRLILLTSQPYATATSVAVRGVLPPWMAVDVVGIPSQLPTDDTAPTRPLPQYLVQEMKTVVDALSYLVGRVEQD